MPKVRIMLVAAILAVTLVLPSTAAAQIDQLSLSGEAQLLSDGSVIVHATVQCAEGWSAVLTVSIEQSKGSQAIAGVGVSEFTCTGQPQVVDAFVGLRSLSDFKQGKATATASLFLYLPPIGGESDSASTGPVPIRIHK